MKLPNTIEFFTPQDAQELLLPLASQGISCGFPSPADDYIEECLDLNKLVIRDKAATFYGRVKGDSMRDADIQDGDILVIDRGMDAKTDDIVLGLIDGEFTVKRIEFDRDAIRLHPENPSFKSILVTPEQDFQVWGVMTYSLRKSRKAR